MRLKKRKKILVLDDDPSIRMLLEYILRKHYEVVSREDGLSAMAWLAEGNMPDAIVTDVEMPRLNGYEVLDQLRLSGMYDHIPVIIFSGISHWDGPKQWLKRGAQAYFKKPFNPKKLLETLSELMDESAFYLQTQ